MYLTVKALHLIAMVAWFAGLFYMPRLFVYHVNAVKDAKANAMLKIMEHKLLAYITTPAMVVTWLCGFSLVMMNPDILTTGGWLHAKLLLVVILTAFHASLFGFKNAFAKDENVKSEKFFRMYNEVPTFILIGVILLAVLKPF